MARITTAIRERVESILSSGVETVNADSVSTDDASFKGGPWYDIREFGAVGDGSTDDGPAIQAAIDAANADGGGRVWYPEGDFLVDTPITSKSDVWHIGKGWNLSVIRAGNLGDNSVFQNTDKGHGNIRYENLHLNGNNGWQNVSGYDPDRKFLFHQGGHDLVVRGCKAVDSAATAIGCDFMHRDWYLFNFVKDAGTSGKTQGSNGIGVGVAGATEDEEGNIGQLQNPTWVIGNHVEDTAMHAITFENVGTNNRSDWKMAAFNKIRNCHTGIGFEACRDGLSMGNIIRSADVNGILLDQFPNSNATAGPDRVSSIGDTVINGSAPATGDIVIGDDASRCRVIDPTYLNSIKRNGDRCTVENLGLNAGDPSSTGQWNGNGREGLRVWDTTNSTEYLYVNGAWQ